MHVSIAGAILLSAAAAASSAADLVKRDSGLQCGSVDDCKSWYKTGYGACSVGYTTEHYDADGYTPGTYCQRACNTDEKNTCVKRQCEEAIKGCNQYKASDSCRQALLFCKDSVKTDKSICTATFMGRVVKYDAKAGTCSLDESGAKPPYRATFDLGLSPTSVRFFLSCSLVTQAGARAVSKAFLDSFGGQGGGACDVPPKKAPKFDELSYCRVGPKSWDKVKKVVEGACAKAQPAGVEKPVFKSNKF